MKDLFDLFNALPTPEEAGDRARVFSSVAPKQPFGFRVAKSSEGHPYLIVPCRGEPRAAPGVRLENVVVERRVICRITEVGGAEATGEYSLIGCTSSDPELQAFFLRVVSSFIVGVDSSEARSIDRAIDLMVELFTAIDRPARKTIRGFWAELFLISEAGQAEVMLDAWHSESTGLFDFSSGSDRIEVKSSSDRRVHHFRLEQLLQPEGTRVTVASCIVRSAGAGTSIGDLVGRLSRRSGMQGIRLEKLARVSAETLGTDWRLGISQRFDEEWARHSLVFFDASSVPRVLEPIPAQVAEVRFVVDCSTIPPIPEAKLREVGLLSHFGSQGRRSR